MLVVLRIGHRRARDARLTTHVCLTARALGAHAVWVSEKDSELERTVRSVTDRFGGPFEIKTGVPWRKALRDFPGITVHLTMYGEPLEKAADKVRKAARGKDVMIVVGAAKVPGELFGEADFNVAVGSQPHSEVAALALAIDRIGGGAWARKKFKGARVVIRPSARGKVVEARGGTREEE